MLQLDLNVPNQLLERAIANICAPVGHALSVKVRRLSSVYALIEMPKREQADELAVKFEAWREGAGQGAETAAPEWVLPLEVSGLSGLGVLSYDLTVEYDATQVRPVTEAPVQTAGTLSAGMTVTVNAQQRGEMRVSGFGMVALRGGGTLLVLRFKGVGRGPGAKQGAGNGLRVKPGRSAMRWGQVVFNETLTPRREN